jgi:hypothetical protein
MALRNIPYLPLYVNDYLTDEKLSCCSLETQGVYIRILCVFHKSETYGGILFNQIPGKNFSSEQFFSFVISKQIGVDFDSVFKAISELIFFKVLRIKKQNEVDFLYQKRMVLDFELSETRSKSGKKGGKTTQKNAKKFAKAKNKANTQANTKQITEYEYEYESDNEFKKEKGVIGEKEETPNVENHSTEGEGENDESEKSSQEFVEVEVFDELSFENVWERYGRKGNKKTSKKRWDVLPKKAKQIAVVHIPRYVKATPTLQYRKNFETYINQEAWNDEIIENDGNKITQNTGTTGFSNTGNGQNSFRNDAERRRNERQMLKKVAESVLQQPET